VEGVASAKSAGAETLTAVVAHVAHGGVVAPLSAKTPNSPDASSVEGGIQDQADDQGD
jgi:hypothetical protein